MGNFFERIGDTVLDQLERLGRMGLFLLRTVTSAVTPPYKLRPILRQIHFIGACSICVILFTGAFTGMVLGLQGYYTLRKFGSEGYLGACDKVIISRHQFILLLQ